MREEGKQQPLSKVGIAVIPGVVWLGIRFAVESSENLWRIGWITDAVTLATAAGVVAMFLRTERRLTLWSLPSIGIATPALIGSLRNVLYAFLPERIYNPPPPLYSIGNTAINIVSLLMLIGILAFTMKRARQWGAPAALGLLCLIGPISLIFIAPTYGVPIHHPDLLAQVAVLDLLTFVPHLIILPMWVLHTSNESEQRTALYIVPGAAYILTLLIRLFYTFPLYQGIPGAPPVAEMRVHALTMWPVFEGILWLAQAGIVLLCGKLKRPDSPTPVDRSLAPGLAV